MSTLAALWQLDFHKLIATGGKIFGFLFVYSLIVLFLSPVDTIGFFYSFCAYWMAISIISSDEQYHSDYLHGWLPVSRKNVVIARYGFYMVSMFALSLCYFLVALVSRKAFAFDIFIFILTVCTCFSLLYSGLIQALCYRFKYSVVRLFAILGYLILFSFANVIAPFFKNFNITASLSWLLQYGFLILIPVTLILYLSVMVLAIKLYSHRDIG